MSKNKTFLIYLDSIKRKTGKTEEEISKHVGRHKTYIAQLKSRLNSGGRIPDKFIDLLHLHFDEVVDNEPIIKRNRLDIELSEINEKLIRLQSKLNVLTTTVEHILGVMQPRTEVALIAAQLQQAMDMEDDRLFAELKRKS